MQSFLVLIFCALRAMGQAPQAPVVETTSGRFIGVENDGVSSFKGIRFGEAPVGDLRWTAPKAFFSTETQNATMLSPACIQQFEFASQEFITNIFNNPPPASESEDCLFLNVWAPAASNDTLLKPVVVWIYGGSLEFGTASIPGYDGTSLAKNQDIVVVTFNYRTNIFGFPQSPDFLLTNLGFLDQELAFRWVQDNIERFGGDKGRVTIMGQSAGGESVALAIARHTPSDAPFRAGIMLSGAEVSKSPVYNFSSFNTFAAAVGCTQVAGSPARIQCLKAVPADVIRNFTNGPASGTFESIVDNVTRFDDPLQSIRTNQTARTPILIGSTEDDGSVFVVGQTDLAAYLTAQLGSEAAAISPDSVRALYPGLNDSQVIAGVERDLLFRCPAALWSAATVESGVSSVFRYSYGAIFLDLQLFPNAGAWHSSELRELFGTFNTSTATPAEATLSNTFQTAIANFVKDPTTSPAENWPAYVPSGNVSSLAKIAYDGNVDLNNFVQAAPSDSLDGPCSVWDALLDFRP